MNEVMSIAEEYIREAYLMQIEDYCNVTFDVDNLPGGVALALTELMKLDPSRFMVSSEKIADLSITYSNGSSDIPQFIKTWLNPYARPHLVGNKEKRPYNDGRG